MDHVSRNSKGSSADGVSQAHDAAAGRLLVWPPGRGTWVDCPADEITWLDRSLLSGNRDLTLHRAPRCAGLRYVHRQWELFSRDTTHEVYLAPHEDETPLDHQAVEAAARHVLPVAPAQHYETLPVVLEDGGWLVSVGTWVLPLRLEAPAPAHHRGRPSAEHGREQPPTQEEEARAGGLATRRSSPRRPEAVAAYKQCIAYAPEADAARLSRAYLATPYHRL